MNIAIASDHAGYELKEILKQQFQNSGHEVQDFGCNTAESCDYPDYAHPLARAVNEQKHDFGITLCGSGNGINMTANKYPEVRSALCWNTEIARLARLHNNANVCALPARFLAPEEAVEIVSIFLRTGFEGGRHEKRVEKIAPKK